MIKLLIFDWDDVFTLGAKEGYYACYRKALNAVSIRLSEKEFDKRIKAKWGTPFQYVLEELLKEHPSLVDEACEVYDREYWGETFVNTLSYSKGTDDLLLRLKDHYILTVATGNRRKMLNERIFPHFNIPNVFSTIISSHDIEDHTKSKPHPYMLEMLMNKYDVTKAETFYIGDAPTDMQMARAAGVEPVAVLTGHLTREAAEELGIKYIIEKITDLESVLNSLN